MQTNLLGKRATAQISVLNPKANGDRGWKPTSGEEYWVKQNISVEIVGCYPNVSKYGTSATFLVMDDGGTLHEVAPRQLTLPPPAHPYR